MAIEKLRPSFTFTEDRLAELRAVVPEAFADGAINWETLREALSAHLEDEGRDAEHFGLTWPGKRQARRLAAQPSKGTLIPAAGEGVDEASTRNLFIEGDNLEVLKLLQKSYAGRVKLIYIDPPYNTGNDFVYNDNYTEPLEKYLQVTQQMDDVGELTTSNPKAGGRFHANWLNMMFPRLNLARQLLREDGLIVISIDNNEVHNLRLLMDEVFGVENFVDCIIWQKKVSPSNDATWFSSDHDYLLVYAKWKEIWRPNRLPRTDKQTTYYKNPDKDPRGDWNSATLTCNKSKDERPNLYYPLTNPFTGEDVWPKETAVWKYARSQMQKLVEQKLIYWGSDGRSRSPRLKQFLSDAGDIVPRSIWFYTDVGHTQEATKEFMEFFPQGGFDTPKPSRLIKQILRISTSPNENDIVLDFFAGSGTTAQAVMEANIEDDGNRRFICVQLPEVIRTSDYSTIAEITKERIRRVIKRRKQEAKSKLDLQRGAVPVDLGFRVYKLGRSNYKAWQDYQGDNVEELTTLFDRIETPLVDGWKREEVLSEILLLEGFPLDSAITDEIEFKRNRVQGVRSDTVGHQLFVCLDDQIANETIEQLQLASEDVFVCLDSALTDEVKLRLGDRCTLRVI